MSSKVERTVGGEEEEIRSNLTCKGKTHTALSQPRVAWSSAIYDQSMKYCSVFRSKCDNVGRLNISAGVYVK